MVRNPVFAGHFYPGTKEALLKNVALLVGKNTGKEDAIGVISPHAGYIYSGPVAGSVFAAIRPKTKYVILGPNHTGSGAAFGISARDYWRTPLGEVRLDKELARAIKLHAPDTSFDDLSNDEEHSIEVQLPFLQFLNKNFTFVPIVISYADLDIYRRIGRGIASAIKEAGAEKEVVIIASSDMTHYEPHETAKKKDAAVIDAVISLDEARLVRSVSEMSITMCGFAPAAIMITAAKELGAKHGRLIKYQTSGETSGDFSSVVGYAGIVIC